MLAAAYAVFFVWHRYGLDGLRRMLVIDPTVAQLAVMTFAFGFLLSPFYEVCKWFDGAVKGWWARRRNGN